MRTWFDAVACEAALDTKSLDSVESCEVIPSSKSSGKGSADACLLRKRFTIVIWASLSQHSCVHEPGCEYKWRVGKDKRKNKA